MYYLIIYYNEMENTKKVMLFNGYPEDVDLLTYGFDRVVIPLTEEQYNRLIEMPGYINF